MPEPVILVPLDGSKNSEPALAAARVLASVERARIRAVYVLDRGQDHSTLEASQASFARYAAGLKDNYHLPADVSFEVVEGSPAKTILSLSEQAAWIVLASHGRGGFKATVMGSVADKVVRGARVPVWLVPGIESGTTEVKPARILVCLDGSDEAERGLTLARRIGAETGASLTLFQSVSTVLPVAGELAYYPPELPETLLQGATEYLTRVARPGEQTIAKQGFASSEIVAAAEELDVDLVVMTASGKGLAARLALGSTTDRVMHSLQRPMLIVPPA